MLGGGLGGGERAAENGVRTEPALRRGAVEVDHRGVQLALVLGEKACEETRELAVHVLDGARHALAEPGVAAVAELDRLVFSGRRAGGYGRAAERAGLEPDVDLDRRVAPGVENLARVDVDDLARHLGTIVGARL